MIESELSTRPQGDGVARALHFAGRLCSSSTTAQVAFGQAVESLFAHRADATDHLDAALAADPDLDMAHLLRAFALRSLGRRDLFPGIQGALAAARQSLATRGESERGRALLGAMEAWMKGEGEAGADRLDAWLRVCPGDLLFAKLAQALHFIAGAPGAMRRSIEAVAAHHAVDGHGGGYVLGLLAFAREETGDSASAERAGRDAVEAEPRDVWGLHAVAHTLYEAERHEEGAIWLAEREGMLDGVNNFAGHVAWHEALVQVELGRPHRALELHDRRVAVYPARDYRDVSNAVSLLIQLETLGLDVGARWELPLSIARSRGGDHVSLFADLHYLAALAIAGEKGEAADFAASMQRCWAAEVGADAALGRELGPALAHFALAAGAGRTEESRRVRATMGEGVVRIGGSRAQRRVTGWLIRWAEAREGEGR